MDLSPEEINLQRAAFLRIEQERKDAEMARTLQQREAEERAEPALSPAEIARILNEVPARPPNPVPPVVNIEGRNDDIQIVRINVASPHPTTRRRPNNDVGARAQGEPDAQRRRIRLDLGTQRRSGVTVTIGASSDEENDEDESDDSDSSLSTESDDENESRENREEDGVLTSDSDEEEGTRAMEARLAERMASIQERLRVAERELLNAQPPVFGRPLQRAGIRTLQNSLNAPAVNVPRDGQYGECTLCFEDPALPTGCNKCKQLIGCRVCVNTWHTSAYSSAAIPACPLCRHRWTLRPDVREMSLIDAEKRRAHLRRRSASVGNLRIRNAH